MSVLSQIAMAEFWELVRAQQFAADNATGQAGAGQVGIQGNMPVDPAVLGGPSTQPLGTDDPMLQTVNGIGLADYAKVGYDPAVGTEAVKEWIARMGKSMVVGQQLRKHMGY